MKIRNLSDISADSEVKEWFNRERGAGVVAPTGGGHVRVTASSTSASSKD